MSHRCTEINTDTEINHKGTKPLRKLKLPSFCDFVPLRVILVFFICVYLRSLAVSYVSSDCAT